ncbi:peptidase [Sporothrix brasiliensis 5110]|uniref:Xaa-Pro aminopeptidase n=1 Tax=Sporothrix brasiliensis 5110 TaxID=1398154 RepID=A0A0C2F2E7_9PEZI|nr:peptidase [Sporothrix brasiliensis 5110]KIH93089.1 peptidase [Sporothrix brasiliensis 5110]
MSGDAMSPTMSDIDHDLVFVEEFDALSIELKVVPGSEDAFESGIAPTSGKAKYPAKTHARKVAKALGVKDGLVYLPGLPTQIYEDSDMGPAFRQRRYFYYIAGADFENCAATYDLATDNLILWVPYIDPRQVMWYGTSPGPKECLAKTDLDEVRYTTDLDAFLRQRLDLGAADVVRIGASFGSSFCRDQNRRGTSSSTTTLYVLHADQIPDVLKDEPAPSSLVVDSSSLLPAMDSARVVKTAYEIDLIRKANDVSSSAHAAVLRQLKNMTNESDIEAVFVNHCVAVHGAKHQAYPVIAGSGTNASVLHYFCNDEPLAGRQLVCLDAGAEWDLYASDVTRTFPISGSFTPKAAAIYAAVQRMQDEVFARFKPGAPFAYLHLHAAYVAAQELLRLGILKNGSATEILAKGTISAFFTHGLGHHVGLEVHDVLSSDLMSRPPADSSSAAKAKAKTKSNTFVTSTRDVRSQLGGTKRQPVTPEMYMALMNEAVAVSNGDVSAFFEQQDRRRLLEPDPTHAQYIDKDVLETYYSVGGVRIEDCLLVTEDGYDNLTTAPKGDDALRLINHK